MTRPPNPSPARAELLERLRELERAARPLAPGASRRRALRGAVVASSERFLRKLDTSPAYSETEDKGLGLLDAPISEHGIAIEAAIERLERDVIGPGGNPASPGYLAYIPGGGLYHSALGDFLAAVSNKYAGVFFAGPGAVRMENLLLRWAADLVGYPAEAGGNIASGGSIANLAAIATARDAHRLRGADYASAVVYLTTQAHHCLEKALLLAGMAETQVRYVTMDERFRMRPDALEAAIAADRARGLRPWLVVAAAGTTDTGAVDPLDAIATVAQRERCWFHVDAAYGGFFLLTAHGRAMLRGIERSDSVVLDPHKSLFLPYGNGAVLVRDGAALYRAHSIAADYMPPMSSDADLIDFCEISPELSRPFRGLRIWLPLKLLGAGPFRDALDEKLDLAHWAAEQLRATPHVEMLAEPELSLFAFRLAPPWLSGAERLNRLNQDWLVRTNARQRVHLTGTLLGDRGREPIFALRICVLSFRTHRDRMEEAIADLRAAAREALAADRG